MWNDIYEICMSDGARQHQHLDCGKHETEFVQFNIKYSGPICSNNEYL